MANEFVGFGTAGTANTTDTVQWGTTDQDTGVSFEELYDRLHLMRVTAQLVYDRYGQGRFIPANSGVKDMFAFRWNNLAPATTPLTEGILPTASSPVRERVSFGVEQYGSFIKYTDQLDLFDVDNIKTQFTDVLGDQAAITSDVVIRNVINQGTSVVYANAAATRAALIVAGDLAIADGIVTENDLKLAILKLKNAGAKKYTSIVTGSTKIGTTPVRDAYYAFVHPNVVEDLRNLTGFKDLEDYAYSDKIADNEIGSFGDIRFIETNNGAIFTKAATSNVYSILIVGKESYANVSVRGKKGSQMIFKPLSSGGTENALNQVGSIGWKMFNGAGILNDAFMVRVETMVTNDIQTNVGGQDLTTIVYT